MPVVEEFYYIEMAWDCATCKVQNPGSSKVCSYCGKPLVKEDFHDKTSRPTSIADRVQDDKLLVKAKAGPDWECKFCGSHQQRGNGECATCGAGEKLSDGRAKFSDERELPLEEISDSHIGIMPSEPSRILILQRQTEKKARELRQKKSQQRKAVLSIGGAIFGFAALISFFVWLLTPKYLDAKISDVYFQHVAHIERNVIAYDSGFTPENGSFDVKEDGKKIHHTEKIQHGWDYPLVEKTIIDPPFCYTTPIVKKDGKCVSQKNGFKKCQKITSGGDRQCDPRSHIEKKKEKTAHYDNDPVYQTWYTWKIHKWIWNRSIPVTGHTNEVSWPTETDIALNRSCGPDETERVRLDASYSVTFANNGDTWKYTPSGLPEYQKLKLGSVHHLKIVVGMVTVLQ